MIWSYSTIWLFQKVFLFCSNLAGKSGKAELAWKKCAHFCKIFMFKKEYIVVFRLSKTVLSWFNSFLKNLSWGVLHVGVMYFYQWWFISTSILFHLSNHSICQHLKTPIHLIDSGIGIYIVLVDTCMMHLRQIKLKHTVKGHFKYQVVIKMLHHKTMFTMFDYNM